MGYECANEDGNAAVLLITNLDAGETLAACPLCGPGLLRGIAEAMSGAAEPPNGDGLADPEHGDQSDEDDAHDGQPPTEPAPAPPHPLPGPGQADDPDELPEAVTDADESGIAGGVDAAAFEAASASG